MPALRFGLFSMNTGPCSYPGTMARIAVAAEEAGFDSLWTPEHFVLPDARAATLQVSPTERLLDPLETLSFLAGRTESILLGAGVVVLPHHNPVILAKRVATLQILSEQRFLLGVGVGHLVPEFRAMGTDLAGRGRRADEIVDAMRSLWFDDAPRMAGAHIRFQGVQAHPRPARVPLIVGGRSPMAYRRAVERGNGFYGWLLDHDATLHALEGLEEAAAEVERPAELGTLEISVTSPLDVDLEVAEGYAELGVDRLIVAPPRDASEHDILALVEHIGGDLIPRFR